MIEWFRNQSKYLANRLGAALPSKALSGLTSVVNFIHTGRWMDQRGYWPSSFQTNRLRVIDEMVRRIGDRETLYLEFGVWSGASMRYWSKSLKNPKCRLHGFDSFEGLPEDWNYGAGIREKGAFDKKGQIPQIDDPRVGFFKGWFQDSLPRYEFIESPQLVLFMDADLYSSTIYVLDYLKPYIKVGTLLYFDDFWDPMNERKGFEEFLKTSGMKFELVAAAYGMRQVAFVRVA